MAKEVEWIINKSETLAQNSSDTKWVQEIGNTTEWVKSQLDELNIWQTNFCWKPMHWSDNCSNDDLWNVTIETAWWCIITCR